uniref:BTB domain-containing protein n=1 Tax=Pyramimonas obovata TaxID=1411642 RepID=A0A7S0R8N4_9CHLO|mmetsp:Transcript_28180/g.61756  ORF Transcript_28180/g.61756 Transcript_28180/m.61756 type:complete len:717 (+) Transcript_28180:398-2548(+)|eukprot:CAMPEP_0118934298 /NCGR_PEP_ID=MMETSP1169-20130426/13746_1 /TAXON_ID=36882 /ORGANISM="Pyramimonas obovata, Strain CCMP722" /LENGTH=716 /DNA_ID=CAMNT_0006877185 /DNA_START=376 /DNA_END=2526 /DNA_ORIENTATION=+
MCSGENNKPNGERKGHKRKHSESGLASSQQLKDADSIKAEASHWVPALRTAVERGDRPAMREAAQAIANLAKIEEHVEIVVAEGAIDAIVSLLSLPAVDGEGSNDDIEREACLAVGLLAIKPEHQKRIADGNALPGLVALLKRRATEGQSGGIGGVARRAADAITNLAHENVQIKNRVRTEGGIPPLVALLESVDPKVQRAAAGALRTLAFKNEDNKNQIVQCNALPMLIFMLKSEDTLIHYEAVGVIGNLVHSSKHIKEKVLEYGALQPVVGLLESSCHESQREAALLLGQFATITEPDYKVKIAQRGAVVPLINMLNSVDGSREMSAFALGRLAQNADNQAGIAQLGGLKPLLNLLDSKNGSLQHNAAFALYGLADNEDNVANIIKEGGVQRLMDGDLIVQASKDCVQKTLKRLEEKVTGKILNQLLYMLHTSPEETTRQYIATALAHLCNDKDRHMLFTDKDPNGALETLLQMVTYDKAPQQKEAALALFSLLKKASQTSPVDLAPVAPHRAEKAVYLGQEYVNNETLSDVTFIVDGQPFYAHRIMLLASSDTFRAMFAGGYKEREAQHIEIPNISRPVFEAMMRCIYTGTVEVTSDIAQDLLRAADQYLLEILKPLCENAIAQDLTVENVAHFFSLAETFHAPQLMNMCIQFALEHYEKIVEARDVSYYTALMQRMRPQLKDNFVKLGETPPDLSELNKSAANTPPPAAQQR